MRIHPSISTLLLLAWFIGSQSAIGQNYRMPGEDLPHEGTWLQWPHNNLYGPFYQGDVEPGWVTLTNALQTGEMVHIIAYDNAHRSHITNLLNNASVPLTNIDFFVFPTDDVWVRDNGPIFVYDQNDNLQILDWGFNGWGFDTPYSQCDAIPASVSNAVNIPRIDLSAMVLEGGAIEHDGRGTMMATRSSVTHSSRNPGLTEAQIEDYMTTYLGFTNFIWLDGVYGQDITDHHIDGFVKFANDSTIVTMDSLNLDYWLVTGNEITTIYNARNVNNQPYTIIKIPLTQNDVQTTTGFNTGIRGSYCNYYIGNDAVVVPTYNDPNDAVAMSIIQSLYPNRTVVGMNVQNLYEYGGMTHCVTQQQPIDLKTTDAPSPQEGQGFQWLPNYPNPAASETTLRFALAEFDEVTLRVMDIMGQMVLEKELGRFQAGQHAVPLDLTGLPSGVLFCQFTLRNGAQQVHKIVRQR